MESPEEQEKRKIALAVELGVACELVSAFEALTSNEDPNLGVGLLVLILLLNVSCHSRKR
ncbi:hypothetical protein [Salinispora pacifica]|uniref:hypothetical protein n=1 Tax=Salinispora pacifica TaxID=351187 RepID=UPI000399B88A|nr:hypothetical protein [Salinispora pacifica]